MEPGPPSADRDARLLGLALLHGYVEAEQLQRAAESDSSPSRILAELRRSGALDDPCLEGLGQALRAFQAGPEADARTGPTHLEPPRHFSDTAEGRPAGPDPWDDDAGRWNSGARVLRRFKVERWKHYRNLRFIGEGGMGRIYKAEDPDLKRTVALKFLRGQEPAQLKRFLFEAQAQALMDHPNICRVYEISEWQGQHYIAMQYVNGPTLLRAAPGLSLEAKLRIAATVAEAVHAAHRRGLIHRDLKPANVLLEQDGAGGFKPYVLDFGLARELDAPGLTASGLVLGTTAYISPEQARGEAHHVDRRTDIYGLGATLFELFTGTPPFGEAQGLDCLRRVVEEEPPRLRSMAPQLPRDLETVVMKCLEKEPARRYDDAQGLAEDLRRVAEGEPIQARRASLGFRVRRFASRNRAVVAISGFAVVGILAIGGIAGYARFTATIRERHAQNFGQEAGTVESILRYARLAPIQDTEPMERAAWERFAQLEAGVASAGRLAAGPGAYAIGRSLLAFGQADKAVDHLQFAEQAGLKSPDLSSALGRCYGALYRQELDRAQRLESDQERDHLVREVENTWKAKALNHLRAGRGLGLEPPEFPEALVEFYGSNWKMSLQKAREAQAISPLFYEAKWLEGEIQLAQATEQSGATEEAQLIQQALDCFLDAQKVAPSDPRLHLGEARACRELLRLARDRQLEDHLLLQVRRAVEACLRIHPSDPSPPAQVAWSLAVVAQKPHRKGREAVGLLTEGLTLLEPILNRRPDDYEALAARAKIRNQLAQQQSSSGQDPLSFAKASVEDSQAAIRAYPGDPAMLAQGCVNAQFLMTQEGLRGLDPEASFSLATGWAAKMLQRFPQEIRTQLRWATIHIERANFLKDHGGDPGAAVSQAMAALHSALGTRRDYPRLKAHLADAYLARGQHALTTGIDPRPDLERAIQLNSECGPTDYSRPAYKAAFMAEACFYRALAADRHQEDPLTWIVKGEAEISRAMSLDRSYYWFHQLRGQLLWARWRDAARHGKPSVERFQAAVAAFRTASALDRFRATPEEWQARAWLDRARLQTRDAMDAGRGLAAAHLALRRDARSAEACLVLGQLRKLLGTIGPPQSRSVNRAEGERSIDLALALNGNLRSRANAFQDAGPGIGQSLLD